VRTAAGIRRWLPLEPLLLAGVILRAAWLTLLLRLALFGMTLAFAGGHALAGGAGVAATPAAGMVGPLLAVLVVGLCALDGRATNEQLYHANLGVGARFTLGVSGATALVVDAALGGVAAMAGPAAGFGLFAAALAAGSLLPARLAFRWRSAASDA